MLNIFYIKPREKKRWFEGDQYIRMILRKLLRGDQPVGGVERVFLNFKQSLDTYEIPYKHNPSRKDIKPEDINILFGRGPDSVKQLEGIRLITAIGIVNHPADLPNLHQLGHVDAYLSHTNWINDICKAYWGNICMTWQAGIDTEKWIESNEPKEYYLIYNKIRWHHEKENREILNPIINYFKEAKIPTKIIHYGHYKEEEYHQLLKRAKGMIFICEHETQGIACNEAMSMNIPVLAWDRGRIIDPNYHAHLDRFPDGLPECTTVPFFDETCGARFKNLEEFYQIIPEFMQNAEMHKYSPAHYTRENLSFKSSLLRMNNICESIYQHSIVDTTQLK